MFRADIDDGEIIRLYTQEGHTAAEIAEQLGCSTGLVYGRLARRGVDRRPQAPRRRPGPTAPELIKGLERGWSAPQLAAAHAVSVSCVCRALARENLMTTAQAIKQQMRVR
jgi:transposase-like protein